MQRGPDDYINGLVSVITPVYNAEKHLIKTLDSVFSQTYQNIEIVLVDDQSNDESSNIIKELQKKHNQIVYFLQPQNMGAGHARNKALELAKGQYVAFLDADDIWKAEKIKKQVELLQETQGGFCFTAIEMIDGKDRIIKEKRKTKREIDYKFLLSNTMISTSSVMIDRRIKGDFRMSIRRGGQDYATWLELLRDGSKAYGIDEALVCYRIDGKSLSSNKFRSVKQIWEIQTQNEGINGMVAVLHIIRWGWNSVKKYWM